MKFVWGKFVWGYNVLSMGERYGSCIWERGLDLRYYIWVVFMLWKKLMLWEWVNFLRKLYKERRRKGFRLSFGNY